MHNCERKSTDRPRTGHGGIEGEQRYSSTLSSTSTPNEGTHQVRRVQETEWDSNRPARRGGPNPLPKPALHTVRSRASSFK